MKSFIAVTFAVVIVILVLVAIAEAAEDWECGTRFRKRCSGAYTGQCYSVYGACGNEKKYCGYGCQTDYSQCLINNLLGGVPTL